MARPRRQTYPLETYLNDNKEGYISNDADTQRNPAWKPIINGLIVTILTDDYIPPIILGEDKYTKLHILDGGSRTAAIMMFKYGNYKITSSVEDSVISYKKKTKDEDGNIILEDATFNIKGKTYDQLPEELKKKFNIYQLETVIHENCDRNIMTKYIKRYNDHSSMSTNQKAFTYLDKFANKIRKIIDSKFFSDCNVYSENDKEKGAVERIVVDTMMCMNHFDNWKTQAKSAFKYLNEHATDDEFDYFSDNLHRLGNVITEDIKDIFNKKDSFVFLTLFDKFVKYKVDDKIFANFLREFKNNLRTQKRNEKGLFFDEIDKDLSTKDKQVIADKLQLLESLMLDYLHITKTEEVDTEEIDILNFVKENIDSEITEDDIEFHNDNLESWTVGIPEDSKIHDQRNKPSMIAIAAYAFKNDNECDDETMIEWFADYENRNKSYILNQKDNFLHMKKELEQFILNKNAEEKKSA